MNCRSESVKYKNILPGHPIKSWSKFLIASSNKTEVVKFLVTEWKNTALHTNSVTDHFL